MIRPRHLTALGLVAIGLLVIVAALTGCSSAPPGPRQPVETREPIPVEGASVATITFADVYVSIEPDTRLGFHYEGAGMAREYDYRWGPNFSADIDVLNDESNHILDETGYRTIPWQGAPVAGDAVELRGIVDLLEFNSFSTSGGYNQAYCRVNWELYRAGEKAPYFQVTTEGYKKEEHHSAGVFGTAFEHALLNLLAEESFVAAVSVP